MPRRLLVVSFFVWMVLLTACLDRVSSGTGPPQGALNAWVSIVPQKYFVERIGGDRVQVEVMVPPGFDPATYEPKPSQIESLSEADLYVRIRVPFEEAWMSRLEASNRDMMVVDQSEGIERIGGTDPHIWLSPRLVKVQAETIYKALASLDAENEGYYRTNLDAFLAEVDELDAEIADRLSGLRSRRFMVFHPAWSYFARDYDLEMIPVEVEGREPSAAEMAALIKEARDHQIKVIFAQPEFSTRSAEIIAGEIGGEVVLITPLAPNWMENLRRVAETLAEALG